MTTEKMTDEEWAKSYALGLAYSQKDPEMNNFLLGDSFIKMKHEIAKECLAEGRRRCAEESKEREKQAAREAFQICIMEPDLKITNPYPQTKTEWLLEYWQQQREGREK
mgnify:CR=1 FL=1